MNEIMYALRKVAKEYEHYGDYTSQRLSHTLHKLANEIEKQIIKKEQREENTHNVCLRDSNDQG